MASSIFTSPTAAAAAARSEDPASYVVTGAPATAYEDRVIAEALEILARRLRDPGALFDSPQAVRDYLRLKIAALEHEVFGCIWLDARHQVIEVEELFRGTLTQTSVYPREVVKSALKHNAAAVVFYHNHPSGAAEPSTADEVLTRRLKDTLKLVDVNVLDHFIVAHHAVTSFAERGLI